MSRPEIIDRSADTWHVRVRQHLPFEVRWNREGWPSHWFRTREAAEAAIAAAVPDIDALNRSGMEMLAEMHREAA